MTTHTPSRTHQAVDRLLDLISTGRAGEGADLYAADALLDATVPGWRFQKRGGAAIAAVWASWFDEPGRFEELDRAPTPDGELVRYLVASEEDGRAFAAHHCHLLTLDEVSGLIVRHQVWCGGRWYADRLQEMAEAQRREPGF
jgi:hypothetical protein